MTKSNLTAPAPYKSVIIIVMHLLSILKILKDVQMESKFSQSLCGQLNLWLLCQTCSVGQPEKNTDVRELRQPNVALDLSLLSGISYNKRFLSVGSAWPHLSVST